MREVQGLAEILRDQIKALRAEAETARNEFASEHTATRASIGKVRAMTAELREARRDVDSILGEAGSNFPTPEAVNSPQPGALSLSGKPDSNGVITNRS